VIFYIYLMLDW